MRSRRLPGRTAPTSRTATWRSSLPPRQLGVTRKLPAWCCLTTCTRARRVSDCWPMPCWQWWRTELVVRVGEDGSGLEDVEGDWRTVGGGRARDVSRGAAVDGERRTPGDGEVGGVGARAVAVLDRLVGVGPAGFGAGDLRRGRVTGVPGVALGGGIDDDGEAADVDGERLGGGGVGEEDDRQSGEPVAGRLVLSLQGRERQPLEVAEHLGGRRRWIHRGDVHA